VTQFESIRQGLKDIQKSQILLNNKVDSVLRSTGPSFVNIDLPEDIFPLTQPLHVEGIEEKIQYNLNLRD
jgi:hypothetical protein